MKKYFFVSIFFFLIFIPIVFASNNKDSFILDQIWYSNNEITEGDTVNIYTAIWNGNDNSLSAKVEFYDKNVILGTRDVIVGPQQLKELFVSWKVTSGDHTISAKVLSSNISVNGKKENIILNSTTTSTDRLFVPVVIKKDSGESIPSNEIVKNEINKVGDKVNGIVPESISIPIRKTVDSFDNFRQQTLTTILDKKEKTEETISKYKDFADGTKDENLESATERPIAQVKLFFLKILEFIFSQKVIFYGLIIFIAYYILRVIYRKIRNR